MLTLTGNAGAGPSSILGYHARAAPHRCARAGLLLFLAPVVSRRHGHDVLLLFRDQAALLSVRSWLGGYTHVRGSRGVYTPSVVAVFLLLRPCRVIPMRSCRVAAIFLLLMRCCAIPIRSRIVAVNLATVAVLAHVVLRRTRSCTFYSHVCALRPFARVTASARRHQALAVVL